MDKNFQTSQRENFLLSLLKKITREYKSLQEFVKNNKPLKIIEIKELSKIPGETLFAIQITNKNCVMTMKASEIIDDGYNLNDFNKFHADLIREAARGSVMEFLKITETIPLYRIISKKYDKISQQYVFTIESKDEIRFTRTADELSCDKNLLFNLDIKDIYDIGFTQGCESILKEKMDLILLKNNKI